MVGHSCVFGRSQDFPLNVSMLTTAWLIFLFVCLFVSIFFLQCLGTGVVRTSKGWLSSFWEGASGLFLFTIPEDFPSTRVLSDHIVFDVTLAWEIPECSWAIYDLGSANTRPMWFSSSSPPLAKPEPTHQLLNCRRYILCAPSLGYPPNTHSVVPGWRLYFLWPWRWHRF